MTAISIPEEKLSIICGTNDSEEPGKYLIYINLLKMIKINFSLYILLNFIYVCSFVTILNNYLYIF